MKCCARKICGKPISTEHDESVRVRFDPDDDGTREVLAMWIVVSAESAGVAQFHASCWKDLLVESKKQQQSQQKRRQGQRQRRLRDVLKEANDLAEWRDSRPRLEASVEQVAALLSTSKHAAIFTGAGISTSAGIGDFRGLFGQWTEDDHKHGQVRSDRREGEEEEDISRPIDNVPYEDLIPTLAHEAVAWLVENDQVQHVITQNCDGLHRLSGVPHHRLSELHGNVFIEGCRKCCRTYERKFDVESEAYSEYFEELAEHGKRPRKRKPKHVEQCRHCNLTHQTERMCDDCGSALFDTIVNFGDHLRDDQIQPATCHSQAADLMLVLGSTMSVTPACDLVDYAPTLIICNRQRTDKDEEATVRVFGDCDVMMDLLLSKLMGKEQHEIWKQGRQNRVKKYQRLRSASK